MAKVECPVCGAKVKTSSFIFTATPYRCTNCRTRLTVAPGFFRNHVSDWDEPSEGDEGGG